MSTLSRRFVTVGSALLIVAGCVTINLYFPEGEVKDLAQKIESEVQEAAKSDAPPADATPAGQPAPTGGPSSRNGSIGLFDSLLGVTPVYAQGVPSPEVSNPAIRKIIESRAARLSELNRFKQLGAIGENNQGLVEARDLDALPDLRARAEVQKIVRAENADREELYKEIAAVKSIELSQLGKIKETYAETLRKNAKPGDWIQLPDGSWKQN